MILRNVATGRVKTWTSQALLSAVNTQGGVITHSHAVIGGQYWAAVRFPSRIVQRDPEGLGLAEQCGRE